MVGFAEHSVCVFFWHFASTVLPYAVFIELFSHLPCAFYSHGMCCLDIYGIAAFAKSAYCILKH